MGKPTKAKDTSEQDGRDQRERFIEAARKAGASEDEADFDRAIKKVAKAKPTAPKSRTRE